MGEQEEQNEQQVAQQPVAQKSNNKAMPIIIAVVAIAVIAVFVIMFGPKSGGSGLGSKYTVLFKGIELKEAAVVLESLKSQGIKDVRLEDGGTTILVPKKHKDSAAINIAGEGIMPNGGFVGFEIFDKGGQLGATDFDKQIKLSRAISGELSRNIRRIRGIEEARVQVVIPQKQMFSAKQNPVLASVFVKILDGVLLTPAQVRGIVALVSSSVEDLQQDKVTVVDYKGKILSSDRYTNEYDRLYALMQKQKMQNASGRSGKTGGLFASAEFSGTVKSADLYKNLKSTRKAINNKKLKKIISVNKKSSPEDILEMKLRFKEKYEELLEKNVKAIAKEFFPKKAIATKVNVELNNLQIVESDPDSLIARTTTVLLLDENNKNVKLTPEIQEALFKALASAVGYVRGRDRIDLRWAPMVGLYNKGIVSNKQSSKVLDSFGKIFGKDIKSTQSAQKSKFSFNFNFMYLLYVIAVYVIFKVGTYVFKRRKVVIPDTASATKSTIFDQKPDSSQSDFDDLKASPSVDQVKNAAAKTPERVAAVLEKWFQEDEENQTL